MKKGDHIRVKDGTEDPDFKDKELSGYTGYIEYEDEDNLVGILWDESTLMRFDRKFIKKCDKMNHCCPVNFATYRITIRNKYEY